ncbi:MAG: family 78 glycoside hydrolase catalytic domain [Bacteroidales bacterium]|nr:family 78 glycoside hydrolase catalytic domain [Bacteroidales bacterium]
MKLAFNLLTLFLFSHLAYGDIHHAPWIAMQEDDTIVTPYIHSPYIKKVLQNRTIGLYTLPMMRRTFSLPRKRRVQSAQLEVCGLGHFVCYLDGQKVGNHFLDPGWSDYTQEAEYVRFDVTDRLRVTSKHTLGVLLGNGFYNIPRQRYLKMLGSHGTPKLKLSLTIHYTDGTQQEILSDDQWQVAPSPITFSSIYGGEDYDARLEQSGWNNRHSFSTKGWQKALVVQPAFDMRLVPQEGTELVVIDTLTAQSIRPTRASDKNAAASDAWIYDFGQNLSGIVSLRFKQRPRTGQTIQMRPAELIDKDGQLNQRVAQPYLFQYTASGKEVPNQTEWTPQFSYYGFRYVEVSGIHPDSILLSMLHTSNVTCSRPVGTFHCSNDTLNRIHALIDNAIRSNLASIPTDCPTREKLGWLEQDYLMLPSMICRYDMMPLFSRLMRQMADAQHPNGMIPTVAPYYTRFGYGFDDSPEWGAAFILAPWILYLHNNDETLLRSYYPQMCRYIDYLYHRAIEEKDAQKNVIKPRHILNYGLGDWYDLGPKGPGYSQLTPNGLTATATYFSEVKAMSQIAELLQHKNDAQWFRTLADSIRSAYCALYDTCQSQTALSMGLSLQLLPDSLRPWAQERLLTDLTSPHTTSNAKCTQHWNTLLTAGDIGYVYLVRTLAALNRHDLLLQLCTRSDIPGYGMQLDKGATSLTESWQALSNVSNNHLMLGHILEWLYGYVAGIRKENGRYMVQPADIPGIDHCDCTYPTPKGPIHVHWHRKPDGTIEVQSSLSQ